MTEPFSARHAERSTYHSLAAAEISISRAAAPALRRLSYEVRTLRLPPVSWSPYFGSRSAWTTWTRRQSQESSSATIMGSAVRTRSEEHTSELQSRSDIVCRLLLENKNNSNRARH